MYPTKSADELRWEARDDARTLARAEEIKADKERLSRAKEGAKEILKEEADRLKGLSKIATNKTVKKAVAKAERQQKEEPATPTFRGRRSNPATIGKLF